MRRSLFKFFSDMRYAEAFVNHGEMLFSTLAFFRDYEDHGIREDQNEGVSIYRPRGGLVMSNQTQGTTTTLPDHALVSTVNQAEIFVFCLSRSMTEEMRERFNAVACVEIEHIPRFCSIVEDAVAQHVAPLKPTFPGIPERARIGHPVSYYQPGDDCNPRWALPDVIATSKLDTYAWQDEFRLVFSKTNALDFQNCAFQMTSDLQKKLPISEEHVRLMLKTGSLRDICRIHDFGGSRITTT